MTTKTIGVRPKVKEKLKRLKQEMGFSTFNGLVLHLIEFYIENRGKKNEAETT